MSKTARPSKYQTLNISDLQLQLEQIKQIKKQSIEDNYQLSIEDFLFNEQFKVPNTPLSIEACRAAGCEPEDLLYLPLEKFERISDDEYLQKMHFNFHEAKRRGLIKNVKACKQKLKLERKFNSTTKKIEVMNNLTITPRNKRELASPSDRAI